MGAYFTPCSLFTQVSGIIHRGKARIQRNPLKCYLSNVKTSVAISKAQSQYRKHNHKRTIWEILLMLILHMFIERRYYHFGWGIHKIILWRISHRSCSMKIDILNFFSNFTGKHLRQGLFFNKNDSSTGVSANFGKFLRTLFTDQFRTTASDYTFIERKTKYFDQKLWE